MSQSKYFENKTVLELGCGVGIVGLALSDIAQKVYLTDHDLEALGLCRENLDRNLNNSQTQYHVRMLDWSSKEDFISQLSEDKTPQKQSTSLQDFDWVEADIVDLQSVDMILAADVIYDDKLTEYFFDQLHTIMDVSKKDPVCYVSLEKRWNFTLADLDVTASAFQHYLSFVDHENEPSTSKLFIGDQILVDTIPQVHLSFLRFLICIVVYRCGKKQRPRTVDAEKKTKMMISF